MESDQARQSLLEQNSGVSKHQIFATCDTAIAEILRQTCDGGVDVILSCLEEDNSHEYWDCLAPFGTVINVGGGDRVNTPDVSMSVLPRGATYSSFDLELLSKSQPAAISRYEICIMSFSLCVFLT